MPHYSYGEKVQVRVRRLFEILLSYANDELEDADQLHPDLKVNWQTEKQLVVRTKVRTLARLVEKGGNPGKSTTRITRDAVSHYLKDFLKILVDNRESSRGSEDWHFTLELWSRYKEENLRRFNEEWQDKRTQKSKEHNLNSVKAESLSAAIGDATMDDGQASSPQQPESTGATRQTFLDDVAAAKIIVGRASQIASFNHSVEQEIGKRVRADLVEFGSVSQESSTREAP